MLFIIAIIIIIVIIICCMPTDVSIGYNAELKDFEKRMQTYYPIGSDYFSINHGDNYYDFFRRQSDYVKVYAYFDKGKIISTCCGILKTIERGGLEKESRWLSSDSDKVWYICDLKVDPIYRGQYLPFRMFLSSFIPNYFFSNKCYGITMNDGKHKVERLSKHMKLLNFKNAGNLNIYKVSYQQILWLEPLLEEYIGKIYYVSLDGVKDLTLNDTSSSKMKILHVSRKKSEASGFVSVIGQGYDRPIFGYDIMFSCHEDDKLRYALDKVNITTDISASIIHANMDAYDWSLIETHEI